MCGRPGCRRSGRTTSPTWFVTTRSATSGCSRAHRSIPWGSPRPASTPKVRWSPIRATRTAPLPLTTPTNDSRTWPKFLDLDDPELQLACVRAYNDFLAEWCSADPNRLIGVMATPFWNVEESVKEVKRCHDELGYRAILFTGEPMRFGQPTLGDKAWDPFWSVAQE